MKPFTTAMLLGLAGYVLVTIVDTFAIHDCRTRGGTRAQIVEPPAYLLVFPLVIPIHRYECLVPGNSQP
jgi:hypothetical protein